MQNQQEVGIRGRAGRAINDLVVAEMFLIQATIESASALGDGITGLRQHLAGEDDSSEELSTFLKRTGEELVEPYSARLKVFRKLVQDQDAD